MIKMNRVVLLMLNKVQNLEIKYFFKENCYDTRGKENIN